MKFSIGLLGSCMVMLMDQLVFTGMCRQAERESEENIATGTSSGMDDGFAFQWTKGPVWVLGDIHGDMDNMMLIMQAAGLVDADKNWTGGQAILVQTGDLLDRGREGLKLLDFFVEIKSQAAKAGGRVINLLGNHEHLNMEGKFTFVSQADLNETGGRWQRRRLFLPGNTLFNIVKHYKIAVQINGVLYVHAGLRPEFASIALPSLNDNTHHLIRNRADSFKFAVLASDGPLWCRIFANAPDNKACPLIDEVLALTGATKMVFGHTPQEWGITQRCQGKLYIVDTGLCNIIYNNPAILRIDGDNVVGYTYITTAYGDSLERIAFEAGQAQDAYSADRELIFDSLFS